MTTSPDSVAYPQSVSQVIPPSEGAPWQSTYRPATVWPGLFGFAEDTQLYEFWDGDEWLHPIMADLDWIATIGTPTSTQAILRMIGNGTGERGTEYYTGANRRALLSLSDLERMRLRMYNTSGSSPYTIWETRYNGGTVANPHEFKVGPDATTATVAFDVSGNIKGRSYTSYATEQTLSGSNTPASLTNIKQNLGGSSSYSGSYELNQFGTNDDSLATDNGGIYYLSGQGQLKAGQTGGRVGVFGYVLRNEATTLVDGGDGSVGLSGHAVSNVTAGGSSTGLGFTQFGMGNHYGLLGKARLSGTATGYRSAIGMELDATVADSATVASVVGLQIAHESDHARGAPRWGSNIGVGMSSQNLTAGPSYSDKGWDIGWAWGAVSGGVWPFRSNAVLAQVRAGFAAGTTYPNDCAGFIDGLQGNFTGTSPGGGGFLFRGAGVRVNPGNSFGGEIQVGAASLRGTSGGAELDLNYKQVTAVTVTTGGTRWSTNDMAEDVYGNLYQVTAQTAGVITAISLIRSGWRTATVGTPVAITAVNRGGTAYGTGATVTLSTWTPRTELLIQGSGGATVLGGTIVSGGRAMTGSSAASLTVPAYITDTTGAITYNSRFRSAVLANSGPTEHYTVLGQGVIPAGSTKGRMVSGYFQGQNLASGAAPGASRVVWGIVAEARDDSGQPSSTGAVLLGIEVNIEAEGVDDEGTYGRRGVVVVVSKTDAAASMEASFGFQTFTGASAKIKTSYKASAVHTQSVFDTRESTIDPGGHGLWFLTGHDIALDTSANTKIVSDGTTIDVTGPTRFSSSIIMGSGGPTITTGAGVPAATTPRGSIYMRTGGGVGTTLYVSQGGGTWNAVALV